MRPHRFTMTAALLLAALAFSLPAAAGGVLEVRATDVDGPAQCYVFYDRWNPETEAYEELHSRPLDGRDRIGLAPGTYQVRLVYHETRPPQEAIRSDIVVHDGDALDTAFYFPKATAAFRARDSKWHWRADTEVFLYTVGPDGERAYLHSMALPDKRTERYIHVPPGTYEVEVRYLETMPRTETAKTEFTAADGEETSILALFQKGPMPVRRKHDPATRTNAHPNLQPNEALTERTDNKG